MTDKERYLNALIEFSFFAKKVVPQMKQLKDLVEKSRIVKR